MGIAEGYLNKRTIQVARFDLKDDPAATQASMWQTLGKSLGTAGSGVDGHDAPQESNQDGIDKRFRRDGQ